MADIVNWRIVSYEGIGPIVFGMTPAQIEDLLGVPENVRTNRSGERDERRSGLAVRYSKSSNGVVEVELKENFRPIIAGVDILAVSDPLAKLREIDPEAYECFGIAVFLTLGVSASLHLGSKEPGATITAFARGRWDHFRADFKPLK